MAGRGPVPTRDRSQRVRPGRSVPGTVTIAADEVLRGDELPPDVLPDGAKWPKRTEDWWLNWRRSAQSQLFTVTDWEFLTDTAAIHAAYWSGNMAVASELRLRMAKFGATPEDRARLRLRVADAGPSGNDSAPGTSSRYGHLRSVDTEAKPPRSTKAGQRTAKPTRSRESST